MLMNEFRVEFALWSNLSQKVGVGSGDLAEVLMIFMFILFP